MWIIDVSSPTRPVKLASTVISAGTATFVSKLRWSAPFLAYMEFPESVNLVNLQTFIMGYRASAAEREAFPAGGRIGTDINGDGDFCDLGEVLPLPDRNTLFFFGLELQVAPPDANHQITDFYIDSGPGILGVNLRGLGGLPSQYQTVFKGLQSRTRCWRPIPLTRTKPLNASLS